MDVLNYLKKSNNGSSIKSKIQEIIKNGVTLSEFKKTIAYIESNGISLDIGHDPDTLLMEYEEQITELLHAHKIDQANKKIEDKAIEIQKIIETFQTDKNHDTFLQNLNKKNAEINQLKTENLSLPISIKEYCKPKPQSIELSLFPGLKIKPGALFYIGSRTGVGKTLTLLNMARDLLEQGKNVLFATYEESADTIISKFILSVFGSKGKRICTSGFEDWQGYSSPLNCIIEESQKGNIPPAFLQKSFDQVSEWINTGMLKIYYNPGDFHHLANIICMEKANHVFIDYIQIIRTTSRLPTRQMQLQEISGHLRDVASNTGKSLIISAQFSRGNEHNLSSFRECGDIEQDANLAMGIKEEERKGSERILSFKVMKNREGSYFKTTNLTQKCPYWYLCKVEGRQTTHSNMTETNNKKHYKVKTERI